MDDLKRGQNVRDFTFAKEKEMQDMLSYPRDVKNQNRQTLFHTSDKPGNMSPSSSPPL